MEVFFPEQAPLLFSDVENHILFKNDIHHILGTVKLLIQRKGINTDSLNNISSDSSGLYLTIRDNLTKESCGIYARFNKNGYRLESRITRLSIYDFDLIVEPERPYLSLSSCIEGVNFRDICHIEYDGHLAITANHGCVYFKNNTQCKFCSIPEWVDSADRSSKKLSKAVTNAILTGDVKHISITTGTTPKPDRGIKSILNVLDMILKNFNGQLPVPVFAEFEPPHELFWIDKLKEKGVSTVSCNLEFLDGNIREELMPEKGLIPLDSYIDTWRHCVSIFGRNQVYSNVLLTPGGFNEHAKKILSKMVRVGVIPSPGILYPDPNSQMATAEPPTFEEYQDFVLTIAKRVYDEGLNPIEALAGCVRNGSYSPINQFYSHYKKAC